MPLITTTPEERLRGVAYITLSPDDTTWTDWTLPGWVGHVYVVPVGGDGYITANYASTTAVDLPNQPHAMRLVEGAQFDASGSSDRITLAHSAGSGGSFEFELRA